MGEHRTATTLEMAREREAIARRLMSALAVAVETDVLRARDAERHLLRLRFALARVDELTQRVSTRESIFESARLEVALSILDAHVTRAEAFCGPIAVRMPRRASRQTPNSVVEDDIADLPDDARERAA
jgi:hypothetical protein